MRVLIALHDYLPDHLGGSEMHAHQVACELRARGHDVTVAFTERRMDRLQGDLAFGELDGVATIEMVHWREYADVRETWEQRHAGEVFRELLERVRPDVVHFHHLALWGAGCLESARAAGARVVLTLHDYHLLSERADLLHADGEICSASESGGCAECLRGHPLLEDRWPGPAASEPYERAARERFAFHTAALRSADHVLSPSEFLRGVFARAQMLPLERSRQLYCGYPGPTAEPRRRPAEGRLQVGYVGGIYPAKGVHVLVEAMGLLRDEPIDAHVWGILDWFPDYVAELRAGAADTQLELHGRLEPERRDAVMAEFDCLVVPSIWYENMPITIWEAFRSALPVVTTDQGGMAEAVAHEVNGLRFARGDAQALADCLRRLAHERELLYTLSAGRPEVPTLESVVDELERLYTV